MGPENSNMKEKQKEKQENTTASPGSASASERTLPGPEERSGGTVDGNGSGSVRITTWNVNGIRNPFAYQPWIELKTYQAMFDTLEADIVVFQELKIQRKDLTDDMVLVPGWDCYFTMPKHKKGYSGVAVYVRTSKVNPIKVEEGITGILKPPSSSGNYNSNHRQYDTYLSLPPEEAIGGYPEVATVSREDALLLDSEGRALVVDFGGFVLIGTYSPANRDSSRDDFRTAFVSCLFERARNLVALGRRVVLTGDLNISRDEIDSAAAKESMKTNCMTNFKDTPTRRMFDNLLEPNPNACMVDLCRAYWPNRRGMYTCWEQRIQARPGNYGARIDYVLCSLDMRSWFVEANIQEGLMGSDHCPVYAILRDKVELDGRDTKHLLDLINPPGMFVDGKLQSGFVASQPKLSGRLLPEFGARRSIKDMFMKKPKPSSSPEEIKEALFVRESSQAPNESNKEPAITTLNRMQTSPPPKRQRIEKLNNDSKLSAPLMTAPIKRPKSGSMRQPQIDPTRRQQSSLAGFFKPKVVDQPIELNQSLDIKLNSKINTPEAHNPKVTGDPSNLRQHMDQFEEDIAGPQRGENGGIGMTEMEESCEFNVRNDSSISIDAVVVDPIVSKESWSKLFSKKPPPNCDGHGEPCKQLITKKPGQNCGRAFWVCSRPVGPDGEQKTHWNSNEWRCSYFLWASDWKA